MENKQLEALFGLPPEQGAGDVHPAGQLTPSQLLGEQAEQPQPQDPRATAGATPFSDMTGIVDGIGNFLNRVGEEVSGDHPEPVQGQDYGTAPNAGTEALPTVMGDAVDQATQMPRAAAGGAMKSVFETKDFLFGDTPREQQSDFRRGIEEEVDGLKQQSPIFNGLAAGIGQFTGAMIGIGKVGMVAKALPWVGEGVAAVEGIKGGSLALESGKAALAGFVAFDPHEERLSNLIQGTPLANPFNEWLASKPGDSAAMGRLKNAMESIGMDAALIGTFAGGLRVWKYLKEGNTAAASRAVGALEAEQRAAIEAENNGNAVSPTEQPGAQSEPQAGPEAVLGDSAGGKPPAPDDTTGSGQNVPSDAPASQPAQDVQGPTDNAGDPSPRLDEGNAQHQAGRDAALAEEIPVEVTSTPTAAMEQAGVAKPQAFKSKVDFTPAESNSILDELPVSLENAEKDWDTMSKAGWTGDNMQAFGLKLSPDMGTFYDRFKTDRDVDDMINLAVSHKAEDLEAQGFRVKLTDAKLQQQVQAFASLSGFDPAGLLGTLQQAGEASRTLTAKMIVVGSLTSKAFQDAAKLAMLRKLGDFSDFGSLEAMEAAIAQRFSLATTFLKITDEIRSQGGRTLRANRGRPFAPSLFEGLSKDRFYDLLADTGGNPQTLKVLADPGIYRKLMDTANYLRIASLVSGPKTQLINILTNGYMVAARPLERIIGAVPGAVIGNEASTALLKENLRQYTYMGSALVDGFGQAVKAITRNDGLLRPHGAELRGDASGAWQVPGTQAIGRGYFKQWNSVPNLIHNALSIPFTAFGTAPRLLGGVDELVKQTVYRSKVAARAHMEGVEKAIESGLKGKAAKQFVKSYVGQRLDNAFDAEGRGLDPEALREANIATFQQDLLPGTFGKNVQSLVSNERSQVARLILPFVKTPTNVLRYGWKMTPGLNMLQGEYKQMISGALGPEAKAQAIGQQTMGALFMGSAAYLGAQGMVTGGGPSDPKLKAQLLATGWQPYSIVTENDDGTKTYTPFNRYDPIALPFGIIADMQDAMHIMGDDAANTPEIEDAMGALLTSLAKQFTQRTYLLSLNQALEALSDPDRSGGRFAGSMAQSFVPFSGFTRQTSTDPYLRDARTIADKMMQVIPGMSKDLPPKYNWLGQPVLNRQGLWSDDNGTLVDQETLRLGLEGYRFDVPGPEISLRGSKVDLRDITLKTGENAYTAYQRLSGAPSPRIRSLRDAIGAVMSSKAYRRAPDGKPDVRGSRSWMLMQYVGKYREAAMRQVRADANVRDAMMKALGKVKDQFAHLKEPVTEEQHDSLKNVMDAFGAGTGK